MIPVAYQGWCINVYCMYAYCLCITNIVTVMIEERKRVQGLTCWAPVIALNRARSFNSFPYILEWTTSLYIFLIMLIFFYEVTTGSNTVVTGSNRVTSRPWPKTALMLLLQCILSIFPASMHQFYVNISTCFFILTNTSMFA